MAGAAAGAAEAAAGAAEAAAGAVAAATNAPPPAALLPAGRGADDRARARAGRHGGLEVVHLLYTSKQVKKKVRY